MRFFPSFVLVASVAGDYPDIDSMQLLQSRKEKQSHDACMKVLTGDEAPVEGTFIGVNNNKVDVSVGDVAPTPGTFCVPSATLALIERSSGLSSAGDFEAAVTSKRQSTTSTEQVDGTVGGKIRATTSTTTREAGYEYKPVAAQCPIDWLYGKVVGTASGKTLVQCKDFCDTNPLCAAVEFQFATGECLLTAGVDKELALQGDGGECNDVSCCYGKPLRAPAGYGLVAARCKPDGKGIAWRGATPPLNVVLSLTECQARCDSTPLCAAFEFEFATGECEMVSGVDKELALQDDDGPCNGESCCYGRPLPAPAGYALVAARCKPDGKGIGTESIATLTECQARCDSTPLCAAFEFEFATGECEMVSGVDKELALQDDDGPCNGESCCYGRPLPAPAGYAPVAARCKPDGKGIGTETIATLTECQARCDDTPLCAAFEFEFATGECEMVSGVDKELALQDDDGPCNGESCCYGRPLTAPVGYGLVAARCKPDGKGIGTETIATLTECQARCDSTPLCAAFEFEFATGECEMVSGVDKELALQDDDGPCNGESCCYGRPLPAPAGYALVAARCKPDGKGIGTETIATLTECQARCDSTPLCAAFEFEFATGECEMVSAVDKELSLADDDGPCNGESCCYKVGTSDPTSSTTNGPSSNPTTTSTTWTTSPQATPPSAPFGEPWDCSAGIVGKTCDYVAVDQWYRSDMSEDKLPTEKLVVDTFAGKPANGDAYGPCRDFRGTFHRVDGGYVAAGERQDGSLSPSGYATEDGCKVLRFNELTWEWQFKYVCDGLDEENYVQIEGRVDSGGTGVREFPMSNWFSREETCLLHVQGYGSGEQCVKDGASLTCGRSEKALCREGQDMQQPEVAEGTWCPGGSCGLVYGSMLCLPKVYVDCDGKDPGDACGATGTCQNVEKYNSTMPRFGERGTQLVCV